MRSYPRSICPMLWITLSPSAPSAAMRSAIPARMSGLSREAPRSWRGPHHHRPVRIAEDDLGPHPHQLVGEEHPRLEHLLVDEDRAPGPGGRHHGDGGEVRGKGGPGPVVHLGHVPEGVLPDHELPVAVHHQVAPVGGALHPRRRKPDQGRVQVLQGRVLMRSSLPVTAASPMKDPASMWSAPIRKRGPPSSPPPRSPGCASRSPRSGPPWPREGAEVLHVGLGGGVPEPGRPPGQHGGHHGVLGGGDRGLVQEDVTPLGAPRASISKSPPPREIRPPAPRRRGSGCPGASARSRRPRAAEARPSRTGPGGARPGGSRPGSARPGRIGAPASTPGVDRDLVLSGPLDPTPPSPPGAPGGSGRRGSGGRWPGSPARREEGGRDARERGVLVPRQGGSNPRGGFRHGLGRRACVQGRLWGCEGPGRAAPKARERLVRTMPGRGTMPRSPGGAPGPPPCAAPTGPAGTFRGSPPLFYGMTLSAFYPRPLAAGQAVAADTLVMVAARDAYDLVFALAAGTFVLLLLVLIWHSSAILFQVPERRSGRWTGPGTAFLGRGGGEPPEDHRARGVHGGSLRTETDRVSGILGKVSDQVDAGRRRMEERIEEFNALMAVVQEEAEEVFLDTASTARGVPLGARRAGPEPGAGRHAPARSGAGVRRVRPLSGPWPGLLLTPLRSPGLGPGHPRGHRRGGPLLAPPPPPRGPRVLERSTGSPSSTGRWRRTSPSPRSTPPPGATPTTGTSARRSWPRRTRRSSMPWGSATCRTWRPTPSPTTSTFRGGSS
jgi:hypothetical protein